MLAARRLLAVLALFGCFGCNAIVSDRPGEPLGSELGSGSRISQVVGPAPWFNAEDPAACTGQPGPKNLFATGLSVVAIDRFDETGDGALGAYYVEDLSEDPA